MYSGYDDTICAPATIPGTGAITIIRVSGPKALEIADKVLQPPVLPVILQAILPAIGHAHPGQLLPPRATP